MISSNNKIVILVFLEMLTFLKLYFFISFFFSYSEALINFFLFLDSLIFLLILGRVVKIIYNKYCVKKWCCLMRRLTAFFILFCIYSVFILKIGDLFFWEDGYKDSFYYKYSLVILGLNYIFSIPYILSFFYLGYLLIRRLFIV
jgi:hypothetical protein